MQIKTKIEKGAYENGEEYTSVAFSINGMHIGEVELYLFNDVKRHKSTENEWTLQHRVGDDGDSDWNIIDQGHVAPPTKSKTHGTCQYCGKVKPLKQLGKNGYGKLVCDDCD